MKPDRDSCLKMTREALTAEDLRSVLRYDPINGVFSWRDPQPAKARAVRARKCPSLIAGYTAKNGYVAISISGNLYYAHRLAFLYMTGSHPAGEADHDNHIKADNRWANLKDVTGRRNAKNLPLLIRNKHGISGVSRHKISGRWISNIQVSQRQKFLGTFDAFFDACAARKSAEAHYGFHENHGRELTSDPAQHAKSNTSLAYAAQFNLDQPKTGASK